MGLVSNRMNVRRLRLMVWLLTVSVAVLAGRTFMSIYLDVKKGKYEPTPYSDYVAILSEGQKESRPLPKIPLLASYQTLWRSPINGYVPPEPVAVEPTGPEEVKPALQPIAEVLVVKMILCGADLAMASVQYLDKSNPSVGIDENVLSPGAVLKPPYDEEPFLGKVVAIEVEGVTFDWGGEQVVLRPARLEDKPEKGLAAASQPRNSADNDLSTKEREVLDRHRDRAETMQLAELGANSYLVGQKDREFFASSSEDVFREIRIGQNNSPRGPEVTIQSASRRYSNSYGVQNGDTIVSINGVPVTSKSQAINWVRQNSELEKYTVVMRRRGKEISKTIFVPRD